MLILSSVFPGEETPSDVSQFVFSPTKTHVFIGTFLHLLTCHLIAVHVGVYYIKATYCSH